MKMTDTRRFAEALGSWLHFEACCFRAGLFSESSFKSAIGSVASSLHGDHKAARVHADYPLQAIQRLPEPGKKGHPGRKRSVDFALIYDDGRQAVSEPQVLIEAKWAGSSHCSTSNVVADLIRLCLMKRHHPSATCMLVLAGHSTNIKKVLSSRPFIGNYRDVIRCTDGHSHSSFRFKSNDAEHRTAFGTAIYSFHAAKLKVPNRFSVSGAAPYPPTGRFQAIAWEIREVDKLNLKPDEWPTRKLKIIKSPIEEELP